MRELPRVREFRGNHFAAVGLDVADRESLRALVGLLERADTEHVGGELRRHVCTGAGGARVVIETHGARKRWWSLRS